MSFSVTTKKARQLFAKAHLDGTAVPRITHIGWGDGGVDSGGTVLMPSDELTQVAGEFRKTEVITSSLPTDDGMKVRFKGELYSDESTVGKKLSTCGIYDSNGNLIAIKNFTIKTLDEDTKFTVEWDEQF